MALYKLLCGVTVMILLTANGCHAIMPECGREREGQNLDDHLPWQVQLIPSFCSGILISPLYVLTDISCRDDTDFVRGRDFNSIEVVHVTCNSTSLGSLCLLELADPVTFTDTTYPICVASSDSVFQSGMDGYVATGDSDVPRVSVPIVGDTECDNFLPERPMRTICAGRTKKQNMPLGCRLNIGGELMVKYEDHWTMIGVVNLDPDCTDIRSVRSYTAVASYAEWIAEVTDMSQPGFVPYKHPGPDDFISSTSSPSEPPHPPTSSHSNTTRPPHPPTSSHPNTSRPPHPATSSHSNTSRPPHPPTSSHPNTSQPPHPPTSSHPNTSRPPHPPTSSHSNTTRPPHPPTSSHPNTSRPPHPPTSSHSNTSQPPHPPTSSHSNTSRPPHPPTCIHPKPPRRPTPDPSLCLYPWSDDCRNDFDSVFGSGVAIHSSPFILLCVLVLSFFGMNW